MPPVALLEIPLVGPGGEPIDLRRTFRSHGLAALPPLDLDPSGDALTATIPTTAGRARTVRVSPSAPGRARVDLAGDEPERAASHADRSRPRVLPEEVAAIGRTVRHLLRFDEDLSEFYRQVAGDPELAWAATGAGRMVRSATVFEDVVKTICTTNCAWSATGRMVGALVRHLGAPATAEGAEGVERTPGTEVAAPAPEVGASAETAPRRAFPTAAAMAAAPDDFYRDVVRAGYRGRYLQHLARAVAAGEIDLDSLSRSGAAGPAADDVAARLLALPGVGPYAAAHAMTLLGHYDRLILDSWTRPTYRRLLGLDAIGDRQIVARFAPYGRFAGLAFWLIVTRDWLPLPIPQAGVEAAPAGAGVALSVS